MTIGQRMRNRRIELKLNPKEIADKIGKSISTYYRYETGEIEKLTISKMCEIADCLQVSPIYLLLGLEPDTQYNLSKKVDINNHMLVEFSKKFKALIKSNSITSQQLVQLLNLKYNLNLSIQDINDWENGIQSPDVISFVAIAETFKVSFEFLLGRENQYSTALRYKKVSEPHREYNKENFVIKNLKNVLNSCSLSFDELLEKTNIEKDKLESYYKGTASQTHTRDLSAIAKALDIPLVDLLFEKNYESISEKLSKLNAVQLHEVEVYIDQMLNS